MLRVFLFLCALGLMLLSGAFFYGYQTLHRPMPHAVEMTIDVPKGSSLSRVLLDLKQRGLIKHALPARLYARHEGKTAIYAGEYLLEPGITQLELLRKLNLGQVTQYRVTLVEGWTFARALEAIRGAEKILVSPETESVEAAVRALQLPAPNPEGWLFPDTYVYKSGTQDSDIVRQAFQRMKKVLAEEWQGRAERLPYDSPEEALTMASIVERETGVPSERGEIAGVFVRRLKRGMRLQTDPTVIYGMGERYRGNITYRDLREATPYNTYVIKGLPPTPIALPGREAIYAALNPKEGESLYFVARGDGSHKFSATLAEHNRAVREYQLKRRKDYRSSPTPDKK